MEQGMQSAAFKQAYERLPSLSECQFIGIEAAISILLAKKYLVQADQKLSGFGTADEIASEAARLMTAAMSTASRMGSSRPRPGSLHPNLTGPFRGCSAATTPLCRKGRSDARSGGDDRGPRCSLTPNRTTVGASSQLLVCLVPGPPSAAYRPPRHRGARWQRRAPVAVSTMIVASPCHPPDVQRRSSSSQCSLSFWQGAMTATAPIRCWVDGSMITR